MKGVHRFVHVGHANIVNSDRVMSIMPSYSACAERFIAAAKETYTYIDACHGRKRRSIILLDDGRVVGSTINARTLAGRFNSTDESSDWSSVESDEPKEKKKVSLDIEDEDDEEEFDEDEEPEVIS